MAEKAAMAGADVPPPTADGTKILPHVSHPPPLPLEWTQIRRGGARKRPRTDEDDGSAGDVAAEWCCEDPGCADRTASAFSIASEGAGDGAKTVGRDIVWDESTTELRGSAVLLLPDVDAAWFQGHFVPSPVGNGGKSKPLGLLAVNRTDTDDCLKCAEGGYKEVDLTIYSFGLGAEGGRPPTPRTLKLDRAVCTGGDLIRLRAGGSAGVSKNGGGARAARAAFDADRVLTGKRAGPYVLRYFSSVLRKLGGGGDGAGVVGDVLPDCAVVLGDMHVTVPTKFVGGATGYGSAMRGGDEDDWMSD